MSKRLTEAAAALIKYFDKMDVFIAEKVRSRRYSLAAHGGSAYSLSDFSQWPVAA